MPIFSSVLGLALSTEIALAQTSISGNVEINTDINTKNTGATTTGGSATDETTQRKIDHEN